MPEFLKLAEYLFTRLRQLGIGAVHGVPGDYNLKLLDYVEPAGLLWVGNANELNAGYAADGYARIKGVGALITTFGVGELSAINSIACAYTERAALVHIVGTPSRISQESHLNIHHTLGDGEYRHFGQMASHVTVAQVNLLDPRTAPEQINGVLRQCLIHSRPVYIEVPVDMVDAQISGDRLSSSISTHDVAHGPAAAGLEKVLGRMYAAKQPIILVDGETRSLGIVDAVQQLVDLTKWPTFTTSFGKGLVNMESPHVYGIYQGSFADPAVKELVDASDLILCFGPHFSSTNSYAFSSVPRKEVTVAFTHTGILLDGEPLRDISAKFAIEQLLHKIEMSRVKTHNVDTELPRDQALSFSDVPSDEIIKQDRVWRLLANFIRPGDILLGETGTPGYGAREMPLPNHTRLFTPVTWLSIGYMLPACQGAALAQRELIASKNYHGIPHARTILLIGDGSFQMTVQELGTIIRHNLNVVIFLINNDGYTIERCIHGMNQGYNDISAWRYLKAPAFFGAKEDSFTASARTYGELEKVLGDSKLADGDGLRMVEVFMDRDDAPIGPLLNMLNKQRALS